MEWSLKAYVLRKGSIETYTNEKGSGEVMKLILIDEEGAKILVALFNDTIGKFYPVITKEKAYRVCNGHVKASNPIYQKLNEVELTLTEKTQIEEIENFIAYTPSDTPYIEFPLISDFVGKPKLLDIVGVVYTVNPRVIVTVRDNPVAKHDIILIDDSLETIKLASWGDLAENEGQQLEEMFNGSTPIVAHNVKATMYQDEVSTSTTRISYILINPKIGKAMEIKERISSRKTSNLIGMYTSPSKRLCEAQVVSLNDIIHGNVEGLYCSFIGKIQKVLNRISPWFENCRSCNTRVRPIGDKCVAFCLKCNNENASFIRRYVMKLNVYDGEVEATVTLFNTVESLVGCDVVQYASELLMAPKEESVHYRNLVLIEDKEFKFLVKMDKKSTADRAHKQIVAQEAHTAKDIGKKKMHIEENDFHKKKKIKTEK